MTINPAVRDREYSTWALDNASEADDLRAKLRPLMEQARPLLDRMAEMGASGPVWWREPRDCDEGPCRGRWVAECPVELGEAVRDWLEGDDERARDRDLEHYEGQVG